MVFNATFNNISVISWQSTQAKETKQGWQLYARLLIFVYLDKIGQESGLNSACPKMAIKIMICTAIGNILGYLFGLTMVRTSYFWFGFTVFNATFNNSYFWMSL